MTIHFSLTLTCDDCGAAIRYEDERPAWRNAIDDVPREMIEAAQTFIDEHPEGRAGLFVNDDRPPYVARDPFTGTYSLDLPTGKYAVCPACDGRAWDASGLKPAAGDQPDVRSEAV